MIYRQKLHSSRYISVAESFGVSSTTVTHWAPKASEFREITQTTRLLRCSKSFKVTCFDTNRKLVYDFLLVISTNLPPILHRVQVMADYWPYFRYRHGSASL